MPILTTSNQYQAELAVVVFAPAWYSQEEENPHVELSSTLTEYTPDEQLEIFTEQIVDDNFIFQTLVEQWRSERGTTSSTTEMVMCPAYQNIIGMGPRAIQFILAELVLEGDNPDHWFWALQVLTRVNPVSDEDEGDLRKMTAAWLKWAASKGYAR